MPETMAGDGDLGLPGIVFDAFLDASHGYRFAGVEPLFHQKDLLRFDARPAFQVLHQGQVGISAELNDPIFPTLAMLDQEPVPPQVYGLQSKVRHLFHT